MILWVLTLALSFTGYLLPWDQLAFWAVTVGANMVGSIPVAVLVARTRGFEANFDARPAEGQGS